MQDVQQLTHTVCIVGAGPAGTYAASLLSKNGIPSLLIDRAVFPRDKPCGESLTASVLRCIQNLDPAILDDPAFKNAKQVVNSAKTIVPNGRFFLMPFISNANIARGLDSCVGMRRIHFDNIMMDYVKRQPLVTVMEGAHINAIERTEKGISLITASNNCRIDTQMLIVANGYASALTRNLAKWEWEKEEDYCGLTAFFKNVEGIADTDCAVCYILPALKSGAIYLMPVGNGIVNVNMVVRNDLRRKYGINLRTVLFDAIKHNPVLSKHFANARLIGKPMGSGYHPGIKKRKVSGDNFLIIGDAGGFNDTLTANGIGHAMISAEIAVKEIIKAFKKNNFSAAQLRNYDALTNKAFRHKRILGMVSKPVTGHYPLMFAIANQFARIKPSDQVLLMLLYTKHPWQLLFSLKFFSALIRSFFTKKPANASSHQNSF